MKLLQTILFSLVLVSSVVFFLLLPLPISAQTPVEDTGLNLVTSPLPINLITEPGATVSAQLKVKNGGIKTEQLKMGLMKFSSYGEEGKPMLLDREKNDDFFDWVSFSENSFEVAPNEWKTITVTFKMPKTAAFGYYYAITFSRAGEEKPTGPRQTAIVGATATLVLVEVRVPNAKREVEVLEFSSNRKFYEFLPMTFSVKLKNKGNVHVAPRGNIFIDRGKTHDLAILEINPGKGNILPSSNRIFETQWIDGFPFYVEKTKNNKTVLDEKGSIVKTLKWDFSQAHKLRWGRYSANMLLVYDDGKQDITIEGKTSFWIVPWRLIGGGIVVAFFMLIGLQSTLKKIWRKIFSR
jgi:hypothetical protein